MPVSRANILRLYKDCLVYINSLKYSDKNYLRQKVRQEFRQVVDEDYVLDADHYYEKGKAFLERRRFL